jgi:hypothetical protein
LWHYLRHNKSAWSPQNVLCVDTETSRLALDGRGESYLESFRCGVAIHLRMRDRKYRRAKPVSFTDRETFWQLVERKANINGVLWVFSHNVGFDSRTLGLWSQLDSGRFSRTKKRDRKRGSKTGQRKSEYRSGLLITTDPPTVVEVFTRKGGTVRFVDTLNYWTCSLAEIGRWVGREKFPMPDPWAPDQDWIDYCTNDTEILADAVQKYINWVSENNLGVFSLTMPSQAMHGFRHTMVSRRIVIHDEKDVQKLESDGYYGGEVYCGKIGPVLGIVMPGEPYLDATRDTNTTVETGKIHHLDCNSLFPAVMRDNPYPSKLLEWCTTGDAKRSLVGQVGRDCIAECLLETIHVPVYCRRAGRSGRFVGTFVAVLCGPELERAIEAGIVVAVRRFARYALDDLFSGFVDNHWGRRWICQLAGDRFGSNMHKRVMNSLYGKFAQRSFQWEDCPDLRYHDRWGTFADFDTTAGEIFHYRVIAGTVQRSVPKGYHPNSFVAISAFVTSYAREHMRRLREIAGDRQVYYQGVDSLYVSDLGLERLSAAGEIDRAALGKLRLEESADTAEFLGWGLYRFGARWVKTSLSRGAVEVHPGEYDQQNFQRLESSLSRSPIDGVQVTTVKRILAASSPVGIVGKDGWVEPSVARWGDNPVESTGGDAYGATDLGQWSAPVA